MTNPHATVRRARSSFYWAMRLLPAEQRDAMFALYVYCRGLDDIADGTDPIERKSARLAVARGAVAALFETGIALDRLIAPLQPAITRFGLPRTELEALIDGMEMDVNGPLVAPSMDTLRLYCRRVAGAVGLLAVRIFGRDDAAEFAITLGEALQLTNILRDVAEDVHLGRLYLPAESLEHAVILTRDPVEVLAHPGLPRACLHLARMADARFAECDALLARMGRRNLWPAVMMMATYRAQLRLMMRHGWKSQPVPRIGRMTRIWVALKTVAAVA